MKTKLFSLLLVATTFRCALAHPGHSLTDAGASHILTSPYHLLTLSLVGAGLLGSAWFVQSRKARMMLRASGAVLLVAAGILWGANA